MKILCDVCNKSEATFYCTADEASLCAACDHRVHHANKLAGKHHRFSLLHPSPKQAPLCDICQERKAFLFCQQDRAILCRECDIPIHKANQHTQKHTRFLLTGVTISATESVPSNMNTSTTTPAKSTTPTPPMADKDPTDKTCSNLEYSTSSISEYLMEMLPGWHVEDLLDSSPPSTCCKSGESDMVLPFWDVDLTENMGFWVPRAQNQSFQSSLDSHNCKDLTFGMARDQIKEFSTNGIKSTRKRSEDYSFAVPQISPAASKRSRIFW